MTLDHVSRFEFIYDSGASSPYEEPAEIRPRLAALAERADAACEETDLAALSDDDRMELFHERVEQRGGEKDYVLDNRVFTASTFGRRRPVVVVHYETDEPADVYPHRDGDVSDLPIGVLDVLADIESGTAERSDAPRLDGLAPAVEEDGADDEEADGIDEGDETERTRAAPGDPSGRLATVKRAIAGVLPGS